MKKFLLSLLLLVMLVSVASATIWVEGYSKSDGSYTSGHYRSTPSENYTAKGEWKGW